jgi:hypothetical protein
MRIWWPILAVLLLVACGDAPEDPESRLRAAIAAAQEAVEQRDLKGAAALISPDYRDSRGQDSRAASRLLLGYLQRHRSINLFSRIMELSLSNDARSARVRLYVAMTGAPIQSVDALATLRADLHHFDLQFTDSDAGWQLVAADWRRATLDELLP